jgi:1-deoxy-D-xylulose-5-phosphate reductoisomerase
MMDSHRPTKNVAVLGATGSIGTATVEVVRHLDRIDPLHRWRVWAASGHRNLVGLANMVTESFAEEASQSPERLVLSCAENAAAFVPDPSWSSPPRVEVGPDALIAVAEDKAVDVVVAAIVGRAGLESTLAAVRAGKRVGLANKETLVVAGPLVRQAMATSAAELMPVDSEHSAIFQCLGESATSLAKPSQDQVASDEKAFDRIPPDSGSQPPRAKRLILTASGGPFREWTYEQMKAATPASALAHPTWEMGPKITIDSATMMNKSLEVIEARWLFDLPADAIEVVVHPQSIIHSMVEFEDGSVIAQLSPPDMRLPIQYALTYPRRLPCPSPGLDRTRPWDLQLQPADRERFPSLNLGFEVAAAGGTAGAVVNAANEEAVGLFLDGQIRFTDIVPACRKVLENHTFEAEPPLERLLELDRWARKEVKRRYRCSS